MRDRMMPVAAAVFLCLFIAVLAGCGRKPLMYYDMPRKVKVKVDGGINVRLKADSQATQSTVVGTALGGTTYQVFDARPAFYKISLPDAKTGWISANQEENWTTRIDENLVKVNLNGGISVRQKPYDKESPQVGIAAQGYVFDIIDTEYSHVKVLLPNGRKGWIFVGRPENRFVEEYYTP